jgi:hypothetical protein
MYQLAPCEDVEISERRLLSMDGVVRIPVLEGEE